jgi:putative transposase
VNLATSTYHRIRSKSKKESEPLSAARSPSPRALSDEQRQQVLLVLHEDRFIDKAPTEVYAGLLDEGRYLCSIRTMYRILSENKEVKERRDVLRHPSYTKPELLAEAPNQVWSWDITKLRGPQKWTYYYLYVIVDIYSRMVTGWMVSPRECGELAERLITEACWNHCIEAESELIIHSDRGSPMKSKVVAQMMADLGVTKSLGRPQVCNDNPYSESNFKTLKYHPTFPEQFGSLQDAKEFCASFFDWYNNDHYHSGIALMTPSTVHYGRAAECTASRQAVLSQAFQAHPERFVKGPPKALVLPAAAWINPPITAPSEQPTSF